MKKTLLFLTGSLEHIKSKQLSTLFREFRNFRENHGDYVCALYMFFSHNMRDNKIKKAKLLEILSVVLGQDAIAEGTIEEISDEQDFTYEKFCDTLDKINLYEKVNINLFLT